jgi:hypothetical protein
MDLRTTAVIGASTFLLGVIRVSWITYKNRASPPTIAAMQFAKARVGELFILWAILIAVGLAVKWAGLWPGL